MAAPFDPAFLRLVPPVRGLIVGTGVAQAVTTALIVARGVAIGTVAGRVIESGSLSAAGVDAWLWALLGIVVLHGAADWVAERRRAQAVGRVIDTLRRRAVDALASRDPRQVQEDSGRLRHVLTRGLDDARPYLTDFLPAGVAVCLTTPVALATVAYFDWISGVFALVTLPLIPAFMVLIGTLTRDHTRRRLEVTAGLGGQLADLVSGAPTLRALRAASRPAAHVESLGARHASATMGVLRLAFLSSFALEFLATLSVALVAVNIGLRLVSGSVELTPALIVLIIVPEVFNPVRKVGSAFHAAVDGTEALHEALAIIDTPAPVRGGYLTRRPDVGLEVHELSITGRDGIRPRDLSFVARPGEVTVLTGPNGCGKSTALLAALGQLPDAAVSGEVVSSPTVAYLPSRPALRAGTVAENLALFGACDAPAVDVGVTAGHEVAADGSGISAGQRQRIGLNRTLAREAGLYLLDEPTAHLSPELADAVCHTLLDAARRGAAIVVASHDARVLEIADKVVEL